MHNMQPSDLKAGISIFYFTPGTIWQVSTGNFRQVVQIIGNDSIVGSYKELAQSTSHFGHVTVDSVLGVNIASQS